MGTLGCEYERKYKYIASDDTFGCIISDTKVILRNYVSYFVFVLTIVVLAFSFKIGKTYSWFIINQTIFHILFLLYWYNQSFLYYINMYLGKFVAYTITFNIWNVRFPHVSLLLMIASRFFGLYFPDKYDTYINKKTIFTVIVLSDILLYIPFGIWDYIYAMTPFKSCPEFSVNICRYVNPYYFKWDNISAVKNEFYKPEFFNISEMNAKGIDYQICFDYNDCQIYRQKINENAANIIISTLNLLSIIFSTLLLAILLKNLKRQTNINRTSAITSLKIAIMLFLESLILCFYFICHISVIFNTTFANIFPQFFVTIKLSFVRELFVIYILLDYLMILLILNEYRKLLFWPFKRIYKIFYGSNNIGAVVVISGQQTSISASQSRA